MTIFLAPILYQWFETSPQSSSHIFYKINYSLAIYLKLSVIFLDRVRERMCCVLTEYTIYYNSGVLFYFFKISKRLGNQRHSFNATGLMRCQRNCTGKTLKKFRVTPLDIPDLGVSSNFQLTSYRMVVHCFKWPQFLVAPSIISQFLYPLNLDWCYDLLWPLQ